MKPDQSPTLERPARAVSTRAGTGIRRMREETALHGSPEPLFKSDGFFTATFRPLAARAGKVTEQVMRLLQVLDDEVLRRADIMDRRGLAHRPTFLYTYLQPALTAGLIEMTIPEKPLASE